MRLPSLALLLCVVPFGISPCHAQESPARYSAFVEFLGNAGIASLNVDSVNEHGIGFRIGGFIDPRPFLGCRDTDLNCRSRRSRRDREEEPTVAFLVVMGHQLIGGPRHNLELGLGVLAGHVEEGVDSFLPRAALTATVGYRLQPKVGRPGLRVGFTPIVGADRVLLRPGFSVSWGLPTPR